MSATLKLPAGARPALRFIPPARNPWLLALAPLGSWLYVRFGNRVWREELFGMERLVRAYQQLQEGTCRLIVAFRHPAVEDGTVVFRLMTGLVAREARRLGIRLPRPPRGYFLFGRDVPVWAGRFLNWMLPRIGAISVVPGRFDSRSIATVRRYLTEMPHPIAMAPEAQVTYHNERVAALEAGTAQFAFWCMEDLRKQARQEEVLIVPVCTSYHYDPADVKGLLRLLAATEQEIGLPSDSPTSGNIHARIMRVCRRLVEVAEDFYARFYGARFAPREGEESADQLQDRMRAVCEAALAVAEGFFHVKPRRNAAGSGGGDFVRRVLAARQAGLLWMFREDVPDLASLSPVDRALADRIALEAWLANRHVELVDLLEYLRADYVLRDSSFDRCVEAVTNLWDLANRLKGGNISGRVNPLRKTARIVVNEPIRVSPRWESYTTNRHKAVNELTAEILASFRSVAENGNLQVGAEASTPSEESV